MLTDEAIDEDIEALLYAQIYYGKSDYVEATQPVESQSDLSPPEGHQNDLDSVEGHSINELGLAATDPLPLSDKPHSPIQDPEVPVEGSIQELESSGYVPLVSTTGKVVGAPRRRLRNPRTRQHISPSKQFWNRVKDYKDLWTVQCEIDLGKFQAGKLSEKGFFKRLNKRFSNRLNRQITEKDKQGKFRSYILSKQRRLASSEVISLLSDSDSSGVEVTDCEPDMSKHREDQPELSDKDDDDDDDIVYIEPPPVPFINLEEDDDDDDNDEETPEQELAPHKLSQELEDCSNDFLVPSTSSEKFNFSLHGSDFQEVEFARPAQPTDTYETESSTSTSEVPKDFNNSVKTIVFNEIDFPGEDLFKDCNMDKFRELIGSVEDAEKADKVVKTLRQRDSSSSSESDYAATTLHQNLPDLSPMQVLAKKHRPSSKHKDSASELEEDDVGSSSAAKKLKKRDVMGGTEVAEGGAKRVSKKKKKVAVQEVKETQAVESFQGNDQKEARKAKRKKKHRRSVEDSPVEDPDVSVNSEDMVKKKSKRRKQTVATPDVINTDELMESHCLEQSPKKKKSKKKRLSSATKLSSDDQEAPLDIVEQIVEKEQNSVDGNEESAKRHEMEEHGIDIIDLNTSELDDQDTYASGDKLDESDDVILVEKVIPVHTIESSDSEIENEIDGFPTVAEEVHLANVQLITDRLPEIMQDPKYDIDLIQSKMSDDLEKWKILPADQQRVRIESSGPRCRRCRERGHISQYCTNKSSIPSCSLCGVQGHQEPRCPHKICLNCGKRSSYTTTSCQKCANQKNYGICHVCKLPGHVGNTCPDLWRRYYLTIKAGPIVKPDTVNVRSRERQWCSGCCSNDHLEFECTHYKWIREYPVTTPFICSFKDVHQHSGNSAPAIIRSNSVVPKATQQHDPVVKDAATVTSTMSEADSVCPPSEDAAKSPPSSKSPIFTRDLRAMRRERELSIQARKPRLNPLSVMSTSYKPYQSVLNPCSVLGPCAQATLTADLPSPNESFRPLSSGMEGSGPSPAVFSGAPLRLSYPPPALNYWPSDGDRYERNMQIPPNPDIRLMGSAPQNYGDLAFDNRYFDYSALGPTNCYVDFEQPSPSTMTPGWETDTNPVLVGEFEKHFNIERAVAELFGRSPMGDLRNFIDAEIEKLDKLRVRPVSVYKNILQNIEQLKSGLQSDSARRQVYALFKSLNMFLFGVHKLNNGVESLNFLRNFVHNTGRGLQDKKRADLVKAYAYVFGGEHLSFNYRKCLNGLVFGQGADKRKHFS